MTAPSAPGVRRRGAGGEVRWAATAALLAAEYVVLTVVVDLEALGPGALASGALLLAPALVGAGMTGLLLARHGPPEPAASPVAARDLRDVLGLAAVQLLAFAAIAAWGHHLLARGAPRVSAGAFGAWAAAAVATALLALGIGAPPRALARAAARRAGAPIMAVALGLLSWRAAAAAEGAWGWLRDATLAAVAALLRTVSADVVVVPAEGVVGVGRFEVEIAPMCSGVDGLGLVVVFQAVWLSLARDRVRLGRALALLLPIGAAGALAANAVRIATLVLVGAGGRAELALGAFHSKLGWLLFAGIALGTALVAERIPWLRRPDGPERAAAVGFPPETTAYVAPLVATLAAALVTSLWATAGLDRWYAARVAAGALVLVLVRSSLPRPRLSLSWAPIALAAVVATLWIAWPSGSGATFAAAVGRLEPGERTAWVALRLAGACVVVPVVEELAFRGFLLPWLVAPDLSAVGARSWSWPAVLVSSVAFGAIHDRWLLGTIAGVAFAAARLWRGRLGDAILAHVACNVAVSAAVLGGGRWDLWG